ncbi:hypothetical protein LCGC14_1904710 [marine sediment metagenome]|uniref:Uncharacterized protein n=1 Tax=marine sediment metagenome TaxID=412755 RepID=A0A0F9I9E6_9ZZZZ
MWRAVDSFEKKLRIAVLRCNVNVLLEHLGRALGAGGILFMLVVLFERTTAIRIVNSLVAWTLGGGVIALTLLLWSLRHPSVMEVAIMVDERAGTKERFSTALALAGLRLARGSRDMTASLPVNRYWVASIAAMVAVLLGTGLALAFVITPDEVATSRFGGDAYSTDTVLDTEQRDEDRLLDDELDADPTAGMDPAALAAFQANAANPPPLPPPGNGGTPPGNPGHVPEPTPAPGG